MTDTYTGPLRNEPLALELHNTLYASGGEAFDGLASEDGTAAWIVALVDRLPNGGRGRGPTRTELIRLRGAVREALHAVLDGQAPTRASLEIINRASAGAPRTPLARWRRDAPPIAGVDLHGASRAQVVLAAFAADAIDLLTGARRQDVRACGAPGCVLLFLKDHPRQEWCSDACGNRARQARHYARTRGGAPRGE
jgi:predicted RNA-binding Zn ribbon-like protein